MKNDSKHEVTFRDTLSTVDSKGKRIWVFAKKPKGKLYNYRQLFGYLLLLVLFATPFIKVFGEPFIMLNVIERKFILFGIIFWPQDFYLFYLMMLSLFLFVILFTVVYGRLFCGWACPQTIFLELIFRKIEWIIDGTPAQQRKLKLQRLNLKKFLKRLIKHLIFWFISLFIVLALLSFIISLDNVVAFLKDPFLKHRSGFIALIVFTSVFYFIYSKFREQVCTLMCPYGRLQGVLLDSDSIVISYDYLRGEPRGVQKKNIKESTSEYGDCIDCKQCIHVCPTCIDIRNGIQLECINCTACIDACNSVMTKIKKPKGLIRYASENGIKTGKNFSLTPRNIAYSTVLAGILIFFLTLMLTRADTETNIIRDRNFMYQEQDMGIITNVYNVNILNKTHNNMNLELKLVSIKGEVKLFGDKLKIESGKKVEPKMIVYIDKENLKRKNTKLTFELYSENKLLETIETNFVSPDIY